MRSPLAFPKHPSRFQKTSARRFHGPRPACVVRRHAGAAVAFYALSRFKSLVDYLVLDPAGAQVAELESASCRAIPAGLVRPTPRRLCSAATRLSRCRRSSSRLWTEAKFVTVSRLANMAKLTTGDKLGQLARPRPTGVPRLRCCPARPRRTPPPSGRTGWRFLVG